MATTAEKVMIQIEADAQQLRDALAKLTADAEKVGRDVAAGMQPLGTASERVTKSVSQAGKTGADAGKQMGTAFRAAASAAETLARTGTLAGESAKSAISQLTSALAPFLPGGAFVAGTSIAILALLEGLSRVREEARRTAEEVKRIADSIEQQRRSGDFSGLVNRARSAQRNREEAEAELTELNAQLEAADRVLGGARTLDKLLPDFGLTTKIAAAGLSEETKALIGRRQELEKSIPFLKQEEQLALSAARRARDQAGQAPLAVPPPPIQARDPKARLDATQREADVMRDLTQRLEDLFQLAGQGNVTLAQFDRTVRELGDTFTTKLRTPTEEQAAAFDALTTKAAGVREALASLVTSRATEEFEAFLAALTPTAVDDLERELAQLQQRIAQFRAQGVRVSGDDEQTILEVQRQRIRNAREEEGLEQRIAAIREKAISAFDAQVGLQALLNQYQAELDSLLEDDAVAQTRRASLLRIIAALQKAIGDAGGETAAKTQGATAATATWAGELRAVADVALGIATALSGANDELTRAITGTAQLLRGLESVVEAVRTAGGIRAALTTGSGLLSLLPGVGGIVGGIGALASVFGQSTDPEEQRRREILEENNERLRELRDRLGEVLRVTITGRDLGNIRRASFTRQQFEVGTFPGGGRIIERDATAAEVIEDLRRSGTTLKELRRVAEELDITLSDSPTIAELRQLQQAVNEFSLSRLLETFAGAREVLQREFEIFDIEDPIEQASRLAETVARFSPAFRDAIAGFDLATQEGRAAASRVIEEFFGRAVQSGQLSAEEMQKLFGDLTPEEFIAAMEEIEKALDEAALAARRFTEATTAVQTEFDIFDVTDPRQQLGRIGERFRELAPAFAAFFEGLDATTQAGIDAGKARLRELFERNRRGELSDLERGGLSQADFERQLQFLDQFFDTIVGTLEQEAQAARGRIFRRAQERIAAEDIEDPLQKLDVVGEAIAEAFPAIAALLGQFDLSTIDGVKAFGAAIPGILEGLTNGSLVIDGLSAEDIPALIAALLDLEAAGDAAERAIESAAQTLARAFAEIDLDAIIFGQSDVTRAAKKLEAAGFGTFDLNTQEGRAAAIQVLRDAALGASEEQKRIIADLVQAVQGLPEIAGAAMTEAVSGASGGGGETEAIASGARALSEVTGNRMAEYLRAIAEFTRDIRNDVRGAFGPGARSIDFPQIPTTPTQAPAIPPSLMLAAGAVSVTVDVGGIQGMTVNVSGVSGDPNAIGQVVSDRVLLALMERLGPAIVHRLLPFIQQGLGRDHLLAARASGNISL